MRSMSALSPPLPSKSAIYSWQSSFKAALALRHQWRSLFQLLVLIFRSRIDPRQQMHILERFHQDRSNAYRSERVRFHQSQRLPGDQISRLQPLPAVGVQRGRSGSRGN
jgi:hypothetical protein